MPKVFISYRRADSAETVNRLYDRLVYAFGRENVFKDVDTLQRGDDFPEVLRHWVQTCDVFLSVIGQRWLTVQDEAGRRRLDNPNDWVRQETEMALKRGQDCLLIPTLVDDAVLPKSEYLPDTLMGFADRNIQVISPAEFHKNISELVASLRQRFGLIPPRPTIDHDKAFRDLVEMIRTNDIDAARDILAAMRAQGDIPHRIRIDPVEQSLYQKVRENERKLAYISIQPLADLVDSGLLLSNEVVIALDSFLGEYPEAVNYDPNNFSRFKSTNPTLVHYIFGAHDVGNFTEKSSILKIPDLSTFTTPVLKILPPPFDWCFVPAGNVKLEIQSSKTYAIPDFAIAKYTITNAQFQVFVEARDGYTEDYHYGWYKFSADSLDYRSRNPKPKTTAFHGDDLPRTNLTWFDAVAFSRWLANRTGLMISLPSEQQWQRAAIGDTGWNYPWGNEFDSSHCNTSESSLNHSVAVTEYPSGTSTYSTFNMSGNIWEWCLNNIENSDDVRIQSGASFRVLRGGTWNSNQHYARANFRHNGIPSYVGRDIGFRIALTLLPS